MQDQTDLLQIKIEKARMNLPEETRQAISAVDWKAVILSLRQKKGYSFEQLGDLETETELLLCGILNPKDYTKELENRMKISRSEANDLVNELNKLIFTKIREEMVKIGERKKMATTTPPPTPVMPPSTPVKMPPMGTIDHSEKKVLDDAGIQILNHPETKAPDVAPVKTTNTQPQATNTPLVAPTSPLAQKLASSFQTPAVKTEHSVDNISKSVPNSYPPKADPYRLSPEE